MKNKQETSNCTTLEDDKQIMNNKDLSSEHTTKFDCQHNKNLLFNITFNDEENFLNFKDGIIKSINEFLITKGQDVEFQPNNFLYNISVIEKTKYEKPLFIISLDTKKETDVVPSYKRSIKDVLQSDIKKKKIKDDCVRPKVNICFNCSSDHALKDCPEERNQQKINKARKQFALKAERYHIDIEQRFAHLNPGKLTYCLKNALGLKSREIPSMFYRMRILGYPPGWLEYSKVSNSGISLFDSEGNITLGSDEEEGEVDNDKHKYDISKIISFPGFNVTPTMGFYDDYKFHCVPPKLDHQQKSEFIKSLGDTVKTSHMRKTKLMSIEKHLLKDNENIISNMDIEDSTQNSTQIFLSETEDSNIEKSFQQSILNNDEFTTPKLVNESELERPRSPSLSDLKEKHKKIIKALHKSKYLTEAETSLNEDIIDKDKNKIETSKDQSVQDNLSQTNVEYTIRLTTSLDEIATTPTTHMKHSVLGTPLLKFSPFDKLPIGENFKQGISDVINFENLPSSTGKYEEMKIILGKVRRKLNKISNQEC